MRYKPLDIYQTIKTGYENRINEIITHKSPQRFDGELKDLICAYRELKPYIKNDPMYDIKRYLLGLFLLSEKCERGSENNEQQQTRRCFGICFWIRPL